MLPTLDYTRSPDYRADIDGLRALAVTFVVLGHYFPNLLGGGFIGVDIFFIISGYLIAGVVFKGFERGEFSFLTFYAKRTRRIFPALITVVLSGLALGWWLCTPREYAELAGHGFYGSLFFENLRLARGVDYFGLETARNPFMHLWSLGVEEQFYLLFPVLAWVAWRLLKGRIGIVFIAVLPLSFAAGLYYLGDSSSKAYFLPHARFWELGIGVAAAYWHVRVQRGGSAALLNERWLRAASWTGPAALCVLLACALSFGAIEREFPGAWALLPCLAAALFILGNARSVAARVLSSRPLVYLGWLSYPLYLWHWLFYSLAYSLYSGRIPVSVKCVAVALSLLLSHLVFRYVEVPLRRRRADGRLLLGGLLALALTAALCGLVRKAEGVPQRLSDSDRAALALITRDYPVPPEHRCARDIGSRCWTDAGAGKADVLMVGNSHAEHFIPALSKTAPAGVNVDIVGAGGAFPLWDWAEGYSKRELARSRNMRDVLAYAAQSPASVILVSTTGLAGAPDDPVHLLDGSTRRFDEVLDLTARKLMGASRKVFFLVDNPAFPVEMETCLALRPVSVGSRACTISRQAYERSREAFRKAIEPLTTRYPGRVFLLETGRAHCNDSVCSMVTPSGQPRYVDTHHYNEVGATEAAALIWKRLAPYLPHGRS